MIEKPFGHDLASAKALNAEILKTLQEGQIYRIDHFLGKETVQNIMALRFANGLFEPIWNRAADRSCSDHRGGDGRRRAARQVLREDRRAARHGAEPRVQLLAMTAMEPPISFDANEVRSKKTEVIQAIKPLDPAAVLKDAVRGQYDAGAVLGKQVRAYRQEPDVAPNSTTETYRRLQAEDRQLALGWRAVLSAHRQIYEAPIDRDRDLLPSSALRRSSATPTSSACIPIG